MMNVMLVSQAQKIRVGPAIVNVPAEGILPDTVVMLALVIKFLGNLAGGGVVVGYLDLQHFGLEKGEGYLAFVRSSAGKPVPPRSLNDQAALDAIGARHEVGCVGYRIKLGTESKARVVLGNQYLAGGLFDYPIRIRARGNLEAQCGGFQYLDRRPALGGQEKQRNS